MRTSTTREPLTPERIRRFALGLRAFRGVLVRIDIALSRGIRTAGEWSSLRLLTLELEAHADALLDEMVPGHLDEIRRYPQWETPGPEEILALLRRELDGLDDSVFAIASRVALERESDRYGVEFQTGVPPSNPESPAGFFRKARNATMTEQRHDDD